MGLFVTSWMGLAHLVTMGALKHPWDPSSERLVTAQVTAL